MTKATNAALAQLIELLTHREQAGKPPPACHGDDRFTSEKPDERRTVITLCNNCPLKPACRETSRSMTWGIWAGIDRSTPSVTKHLSKENH